MTVRSTFKFNYIWRRFLAKALYKQIHAHMKTVHFKQHNTKMAIGVAVVYLIIVFSVAYFGFGGINGMAEKVNHIGSPKGVGLIVGIVVLAPLFILLQFLHPNLTVGMDAQKLMIQQKGKQDMIIHFNAIDRIELNTKTLNRLDIYDKQNNLLNYLHPSNKPEILQLIIREIVHATGFGTIKSSRKIMGRNIETLIYSKKVA